MASQISMDGHTGTIGAGGVVTFGSDEIMNVIFYTKSVHDPVASQQRGRPWNRAVTYVRIQHPGEKDYVDRPVAEQDIAKMRWSRQWAAFEKKQEQAPNGTPIECLFPESPEIPANLHSIAIHTVEQLAGLTAHGLQSVGIGATQWQQRAKQFLDASRGGASLHRLKAENDKQANAIETLNNQVALLKAQLDRILAETKQGVPPGMIPRELPTIAQAHAELTPAYAPMPELSDEPLFVEIPDGMEGPVIPEPHPDLPRRRGRPPLARDN